MDTLNKRYLRFLVIMAVCFSFYSFNVGGVKTAVDRHFSNQQRISENNTYESRREAENSARSLITNYVAAKLEYETYHIYIGTKDKAREQRALDARTSANMTISKYNNFMQENSFLFENNIPEDLPLSLAPIGD